MIYLFAWVIICLSGCSGENRAFFQNKQVSSAYTGGRHFGIIRKPVLLMTLQELRTFDIDVPAIYHCLRQSRILCSPTHKYAFLHFMWFCVHQTWAAIEPITVFADLSLQNSENGTFYVFHSINRPTYQIRRLKNSILSRPNKFISITEDSGKVTHCSTFLNKSIRGYTLLQSRVNGATSHAE